MTISAPFSRKTIETAIYTWVNGAVGIPCVWVDQKAPQPQFPYVSVSFVSIASLAPQDEERVSYDSGASAGAEIGLLHCGLRRALLSVNVMSETNDAGQDARSLADRLISSLSFTSFAAPLVAAGLAYVRCSDVRRLDETQGDSFVQRAQLDVTFTLAANASETTGWIELIDALQQIDPLDDLMVEFDLED